jgi:pyruvate dehydrogenase E2 component (dihydrolipoamide acetyltransferase)
MPESTIISKNSRSFIQSNSGQAADQAAIFASPLAKKMARIENISLEEVAKSCSKNLVKKEDILNYIREKHSPGVDVDHYLLDTSLMRRTIARRMKESVLTSPHYFVSIDADMTNLVDLRKKLNEGGESKISYNDLLMKIAAKATEDFPLINSTYQGEKIKVFKDINFGLAIGLEKGLIVPVVKQVNKKSVTEIAEYNNRNISAAKNGSLKESDITGGTITLSNLGMYGINNFTAIINQPESCIIAVGAIIEKPVVKDHQIVIREMMNITCSFDHRIIDGTMGAAFLGRVKQLIEDPRTLFSS